MCIRRTWSASSSSSSSRVRLRPLPAVAALLAAAGGVPAAAPAQPAPGRQVYDEHCAVCHGAQGDGRGAAAARFATPPRDFTAGRYKIRSTPSGQLPTDDDLRRSIVQEIGRAHVLTPVTIRSRMPASALKKKT